MKFYPRAVDRRASRFIDYRRGMPPNSRVATPIAPEMTVREARDLYHRENGFSLAMYS